MGGEFMPKPRKRSQRVISKRDKILGVLLLCFTLGVLIGILLVHFGIEFGYTGTSTHMENFLNNFDPLDYQRAEVLKESMFKYGLFLVLIWFLGFFPIGALGALALLLAKGAGLGFTISFLMKSYGFSGLFYTVVLTLPQNLGMIPAYFFLCYNCLRFIFEHGGFFEDKQTRPLSILEYCLVLMICLSVTVGVSLYEAFAVPWVFENLL